MNGAVTRYVYDGEDILLEYDGANALQARYSHGQRTDQPLAMERGATLAFFQADHLGSIRQVTNAAGSIVNAYDYDAYGNFETLSESLPQPYAFTGREFDPESGLHYYRARYYDPETGRFISEDPIGFGAGDTNLYRYVFNDPVNLVDPSGLAATKERSGTLQPALITAPVLFNLGQTLGLVFRSVARDLLVGVLASAPDNPNDPDQPRDRDNDDNDRPGGGGGPGSGSGSSSGSGPGSDTSPGGSTGAGGENPNAGGGAQGQGASPGSDAGRPDLGKPGTARNPDGTPKNPIDQLDQIKEAQKRGKLIDDTKKSERRVKDFLRDFKGPISDIDPSDFD